MTIVTIPHPGSGSTSASGVPRDPEVTASLDTLGLRDALMNWCGPGLAASMIEAGQVFRQGWRTEHAGPLPDTIDLSYAAYEEERGRPTGYNTFAQAKSDLVADFRRKVADGTFLLVGLSMLPVPATTVMAVPALWAKRLEFRWSNGTLRMGADILIVDVEVRWAARSTLAQSSGGRPRFPWAKMIEIAQILPRASNNKETATALLGEFQARWQGISPPQYRTVYDHVAEIYTRAATNARFPSP